MEKMEKKVRFFLLIICCTTFTHVFAKKEIYKDSSQPIEKRVKDLLKRMTLREKLYQLSQLNTNDVVTKGVLDLHKLDSIITTEGAFGAFPCTGIPSDQVTACVNALQHYCMENTRLGIPVFIITEALHGPMHFGCTNFPTSIAISATFNTDLAYDMARANSEELYLLGVNQILCPVLDVARDQRWGRTDETFGEDPYLNGMMGIAEVKGYLENNIQPMLKHFGPGGEPRGGLNLASVDCSLRDLLQVHVKPFEMVVKNTGIRAVMSSYNSWDGVPNSGSLFLLTELLRDTWGFEGYVYSDWGAIGMMYDFQHVAQDYQEAGMIAMNAGLDMEAIGGSFRWLEDLVKRGDFDGGIVDRAVSRILKVKFEMGLFEHPYRNEGKQAVVHTQEHQEVARKIADESIVLMKNENNLLPLQLDKLKTIAVIGPNANMCQNGSYSGSNGQEVTALAGLTKLLEGKVDILYAQGCDLVTDDRSGFDEALKAAKASDFILYFAGQSSNIIGEGHDQTSLDFMGVQQELLEALYETKKPIVLILVQGKPISIPWAKKNIPAIVSQWYGGEKAGDAIADMLFGNTVPSGKTPISWPQSVGHLPCYYNHLPADKGFYHKPGSPNHPGFDYIFSSPDPLWAFGHGLSYTSFEYGELTLSATELTSKDTLTVSTIIRNTGDYDGSEVVQLYFNDFYSSIATPVQQLKAFTKVSIPSGGAQKITLRVPISEFAIYDKDMKLIVEPGEYEIQIGSASDDIRQKKIILVK